MLEKLIKMPSTYVVMVIRFGGIAAKKSPIGKKAANAFKKSLNPSPPPLGAPYPSDGAAL
jgi:hypothetical protein